MSHLLVVFGATGHQGISVVNTVTTDPELCKRYKVRCVTRDPSKPAAQSLSEKGVEVVQGDFDHESSIEAALDGAHTVFLMTRTTIQHPEGVALEMRQGKHVADAAVSAGAQYLIYSSEYSATGISGGKYPVAHFDVKHEVEQYIRGLPIQSAFVAPGSFMQNFEDMFAPRPVGDGSYAICNIHTPETMFPWIDAEGDMGKFVASVLAEPDRFEGQVLAVASEIRSLEYVVQVMSKVTGKTIRYTQISEAKFREFLPPGAPDAYVNMFLFYQHCGYYGPRMTEDVEWAVKNARGRLTTVEEYIEKHFKLA